MYKQNFFLNIFSRELEMQYRDSDRKKKRQRKREKEKAIEKKERSMCKKNIQYITSSVVTISS